MSPSPTLLGLPVELQVLVAEELDDDALRTVRLTCRELVVNTMNVFAETFFDTRKHLYSTRSLTALVEMSKIPRLARHIRAIEFVIIRFDQRRGPSVPVSMKERMIIDANKYWYERDKRHVRTNASKYLMQIFTNLKKLGAGRELSITTDLWKIEKGDDKKLIKSRSEDCAHYKRPTGVYGTADFLNHIYPWTTPQQLRGDHLDPVAQDVNDALVATGHILEYLDFGYHSAVARHHGSSNLWNISGRQLSSLSVSWSGLKTVKLFLEDESPSESLPSLLRVASSLAEVWIQSRHAIYLQILNQNTRKNQLSVVGILSMDCEYLELVRFIARQAGSLKDLYLCDVLMESEFDQDTWKSWRLFFGVASQRLSLRCLELYSIHEYSLRVGHTRCGGFFLADGRTCKFAVEGDEEKLKNQMKVIVKVGVFCEVSKFKELESEFPDEEGGSDGGPDGEESEEDDVDEDSSDDDEEEEEEEQRFAEKVVNGLKEWKVFEEL